MAEGIITTLRTAIVALVATAPTLVASGVARAVADAETFLALEAVPPPYALVVFAGERLRRDLENEPLGGTLHQMVHEWDVYLGTSSFAPEGEGRSSAETLLDEAVGAADGQVLITVPRPTRLFYVGAVLHDVNKHSGAPVVIYRLRFRSPWQRIGAPLYP